MITDIISNDINNDNHTKNNDDSSINNNICIIYISIYIYLYAHRHISTLERIKGGHARSTRYFQYLLNPWLVRALHSQAETCFSIFPIEDILKTVRDL